MLGWEFFIERQRKESDAAKSAALASWMAGIGGTQWIDDLVSRGVATHLGGNGYPNRYTVQVRALVGVLEQGVPKHSGPFVLGDDYITPGGWTGEVDIDMASLRALAPDELLFVEAWDQS